MKIFKKLYFTFLLAIFLVTLTSSVFSLDLIVPDTGQDLCYDWAEIISCPSEGEDFYGQDGSYTINPPDLTDNEDGTVTDNLTGLVWEQKTEENETYSYTYNDAITYCNELTLGGYSDWRIPTRKEYSTILNFGRVSPAMDTNYFPYYSYTTANEVYYWTYSDYYNDSSQVWRILISFGLIENGPKTEDPPILHKVRCVRGDIEPAANYTNNGDGTVTDNVTGLIWEQKTDDGGSRDKDITYTWKDALAYCENLLLASYDDWRLPNPKEFERLVDLGSSSPAVDTTYFPNTNNGLYWTGTTCSGCHKMKAFAIDFTDGELYYGNKYRNDIYYENYSRCVRHPDPDGDGVIYPNDNCPYIANPGQEDEGDSDGSGDACDNCLETPNGSNLGTCVKTKSGMVVSYRVGDPKDFITCTSDANCTDTGGTCQLEQGDCNVNGCGDTCECYMDCNDDGAGDGKVTGADLAVLKQEYGRFDCSEVDPCYSDGNEDGKVTGADLSLLKNEYGRFDCPACP